MSNVEPTALSDAEERIWQAYVDRLTELRADERAATVLAHYRMEHFLSGSLDGTRICDLSTVIHHLENALEPVRAPLPDIALMEPDDIERHPGFDGVEEEILAEEEFLLTVRKAIHGE